MEGGAMYALQDIPGKGKGLVARKLIPKGTRILEERPVIIIPERKKSDAWLNAKIAQQVDSLNEHQRQSFVALHNLYPYKNSTEMYLGIIRTNGLPIEVEGMEAQSSSKPVASITPATIMHRNTGASASNGTLSTL